MTRRQSAAPPGLAAFSIHIRWLAPASGGLISFTPPAFHTGCRAVSAHGPTSSERQVPRLPGKFEIPNSNIETRHGESVRMADKFKFRMIRLRQGYGATAQMNKTEVRFEFSSWNIW
jgi:hypothetical protein